MPPQLLLQAHAGQALAAVLSWCRQLSRRAGAAQIWPCLFIAGRGPAEACAGKGTHWVDNSRLEGDKQWL